MRPAHYTGNTQSQGELKELGQVTHQQGQSWDLSSGNLLTNENFLILLVQVGGTVDSKIPTLKMERPKLKRPCDMPSKFLRDLGVRIEPPCLPF